MVYSVAVFITLYLKVFHICFSSLVSYSFSISFLENFWIAVIICNNSTFIYYSINQNNAIFLRPTRRHDRAINVFVKFVWLWIHDINNISNQFFWLFLPFSSLCDIGFDIFWSIVKYSKMYQYVWESVIFFLFRMKWLKIDDHFLHYLYFMWLFTKSLFFIFEKKNNKKKSQCMQLFPSSMHYFLSFYIYLCILIIHHWFSVVLSCYP